MHSGTKFFEGYVDSTGRVVAFECHPAPKPCDVTSEACMAPAPEQPVFPVGAVVRLKSGGPAMTVTFSEPGITNVQVAWFPQANNADSMAEAQQHTFPVAALELVADHPGNVK